MWLSKLPWKTRTSNSRMLVMKNAFKLALSVILVAGAVFAYNSDARNSLLRTRDQVADQRAQLERAYSQLDQQIDQLQQKKTAVYHYLQDCDRSIKDLDRALNAQDAAIRDIR